MAEKANVLTRRPAHTALALLGWSLIATVFLVSCLTERHMLAVANPLEFYADADYANVLSAVVDAEGWVDYEAMRNSYAADLDRYLDAIGRFDERLGHGDATDWFLRARAAGARGRLMEDVLSFRRMHSTNRSRSRAASSQLEFLDILKANLDRKRAAGI